MSFLRLVVVALATLFLFVGVTNAGYADHYDDYDDDYDYDHHPKIWGPKCYDKKWDWSYNSYGQHPCKIAAYLLSKCYEDEYYIPRLGPKGYEYPCKDGLCECNTVIYNLLSACEACQGGSWPYFKDYSKHCKKIWTPCRYPYPVPYGTKIPRWAFLDTSGNSTWDPTKAKETGCYPEADEGTDLAY